MEMLHRTSSFLEGPPSLAAAATSATMMAAAAGTSARVAGMEREVAAASGVDLTQPGEGGKKKIDIRDYLGMCSDVQLDVDEDLFDEAPEEEVYKSFWLRVYVPGAQLPAAEDTYVIVSIGEKGEKDSKTKVLKGPDAPGGPSKAPMWQWSFAEQVVFVGVPIRVEFQVKGKRMLSSDATLGKASFVLSSPQPKAPQRKEFVLTSSTSVGLCSTATDSKLTVVWEIADNLDFAPPLHSVAELGVDGSSKKKWSLQVNALSVSLQRKPSTKVKLQMYLERPADGTRMPTRDSPPEKCEKLTGEGSQGYHARWKDAWITGDTWTILDSEAALMGYILHICVLEEQTVPGVQPQVLCTWREPLEELLYSLREQDEVLRFDGQLLGPVDEQEGTVRCEIDIFHMHPHRRPRRQKQMLTARGWVPPSREEEDSDGPDGSGDRAASKVIISRTLIASSQTVTPNNVVTDRLPLRRGLPRPATWQNRITYYCTCWADGLTIKGKVCDPLVSIQFGENVGQTDAIQGRTNFVEWRQKVPVSGVLINRAAVIQVFNDAVMGSGKGEKELICQAKVNDLCNGSEYWLHCYGGAVGATNQEVALQMMRGIKTPSTYRGTVVVHFTTLKKVAPGYFKSIEAQKKPHKLTIRIRQGVGFHSMAGKKVSILVQVAGCRLPDYRALRASKDEDKINPQFYNSNILAIAAEVDARGVLRPESGHVLCERSTAAASPLMLPPNVQYAYLYIIAQGETSSPPKIFGKVRLFNDLGWQKMHYDASVMTPPESHFQDELAGLLLCSASTTPVSTREPGSEIKEVMLTDELMYPQQGYDCCGTQVPTGQGSPGIDGGNAPGASSDGRDVNIMYCHIDVLAARELPPADKEGHCEPCYTIHVAGKTFTFAGERKQTLNPTFMHRIVIPVELEHDRTAPIILQVADARSKFASMPGFVEPRNIASVVVEQPIPQIEPEGTEQALDLNTLHEARWYALDAPQVSNFDPAKHGGVDQAWLSRPRILLAVAFSSTKNIQGSDAGNWKSFGDGFKVEMATNEHSRYSLDIDLLGLRSLPKSLRYPELVINSYWDRAGVGTHERGNVSNPTFGPGRAAGWSEFAEKVRDVMAIRNDTDTNHHVKSAVQNISNERDDVPRVFISHLVGERIRAPVYDVPVLDYLQPASDSNGYRRSDSSMECAIKGEPFVLMPNITFVLQNHSTGQDYGLISLPMNQIRSRGGGPFDKDWSEVSADQFQELPEELRRVQGLQEAVERGAEAYDIFVDVFASKSGYVHLDVDLRMMRSLKDTDLFTITDTPDDKEPEEHPHVQEFNPYDKVLGNPRRLHDVFQAKYMPSWKCENRQTDDGKKPKGPKDLFEACLSSGKHHGKNKEKLEKLEDLEHFKTGQMIQGLAEKGWRCMSHLVAPEFETEGKHCLKNASKLLHRDHMKKCLRHNEHTFMRPVGHNITPLDRDSRILARLRMGPPDDVAEYPSTSKSSSSVASTAIVANKDIDHRNFLVVKFHLPGTVIWVAPEHRTVFGRPGMPLMAVRLADGTNEVVVVRMPAFDLRFAYEQSWYPVKTFRQRSSTWQTMMDHDRVSAQVASNAHQKDMSNVHHKDKRARREDTEILKTNMEKMKKDVEYEKEVYNKYNDGHRGSVWVEENGFVCRIKKASNTKAFDRCDSTNWYRTVFGHVDKSIGKLEVKEGVTEDREYVASHALSRSMNLRAHFMLPDSESATGRSRAWLKGSVACRRILGENKPRLANTHSAVSIAHATQLPSRSSSGNDVNAGSEEQAPPRDSTQLHSELLPIEKLWKLENVIITVNLLTIHGCAKLKDCSRVKIVARIGDVVQTIEQEDIISLTYGQAEPMAQLYTQLQLHVQLPGPAMLVLEVYKFNTMGIASLVATTLLDVEDRFLALDQRTMCSRTMKDNLHQTVWPLKDVLADRCIPSLANDQKRTWEAPKLPKIHEVASDEVFSQLIERRRPPQEWTPLEYLELTSGLGENLESDGIGTLRGWVDISIAGTSTTPSPPPRMKTQHYELRVRIHKVENVQVYRDSGERNDLLVQGSFKCRDVFGRVHNRLHVHTDCHKFAVETASYKQLWVFPFEGPVSEAYLELGLLDQDKSDHDIVYNPIKVFMSQLIHTAMENERHGRPNNRVEHPIIFTEWEGMNDKASRWKRWRPYLCPHWYRMPLPKRKMHARLTADFEVLNAEQIAAHPAKDEVFGSPEDRLKWQKAVATPRKTLKRLLGKTNSRRVYFLMCVLGPVTFLTLSLLITLLVVYYFVELKNGSR